MVHSSLAVVQFFATAYAYMRFVCKSWRCCALTQCVSMKTSHRWCGPSNTDNFFHRYSISEVDVFLWGALETLYCKSNHFWYDWATGAFPCHKCYTWCHLHLVVHQFLGIFRLIRAIAQRTSAYLNEIKIRLCIVLEHGSVSSKITVSYCQ